MIKVVKTTFEQEQADKDEAFLKLSPIERLDQARRVRERMKKPGVNYSYDGMVVRIRKFL
jgi:hypothetical protein